MAHRLGIAYHPSFRAHDTGPGHPERPSRLEALEPVIREVPHRDIETRLAKPDEIEAVHDPQYLQRVQHAIESGVTALDPDTAVCEKSWEIALRAAGAGVALAEALMNDEVDRGFACVRPPGHHATRNQAMGFCLINNIAVAARFLADQGVRVGILDWDVHHGNGTIDIFAHTPTIPVWNLRQLGLWPVSGSSPVIPHHMLDIPLLPGSGDDDYLDAMRTKIIPAIDEYDPEVLLISAGFDAHAGDPLANQNLSSEVYGVFTRLLNTRPILSFLEGGYDLEALHDSVRAHLRAMIEDDANPN